MNPQSPRLGGMAPLAQRLYRLDRKTSLTRALAGIMVLGGVVLLAALMATGQDGRQEWKLARAGGDRVHFTVERWRPGSHWSTSTDVPLDRFHGLSPDQFDRGGRARFEYVQDAGRLVCEGDFSWGRGSGTFQFQADPDFVTDLKKLGYEAPDGDEIFNIMMMGIGIDFARSVRDAGLHASTQQLIELRIHGLTTAYIRETQLAGYRNLSARDYIQMKIHGVQPAFLRDLKDAGYELSSDQVVELRIHGVSSAFLHDLKDYGLQPKASDMVQLKIHGVSADYLKDLKDAGYGNLDTARITELRIHGVDTGFIRDARALGYNFSAQELIDLRIHGVDGNYLRRLNDSGMRNLNAAQIEKLKIHGID